MTPRSLVALLFACALPFVAVHAQDDAEKPNLLANGTFAEADENGVVKHWPKPSDKISYPQEDDANNPDGKNRFMRIHCVEPGKMNLAYREVRVTPGDKLKLTFRVRYDNVKAGEQPWFDARVMMEVRNADGKKVTAQGLKVPNFKGTHKEWKNVEINFTVPDEAVKFVMMPCLFNVASGTFDLDSFVLVKTE